jgi:uncharacterized protein
MTDLLSTGPPQAAAHLVFAHGAGAPMTSPFLDQLAVALAGLGVRTTRFEFGYMAQQRCGGPKRPPPPVAKLAGEYRAVVHHLERVREQRLLIGGKSMGGRVASLIAGELHAEGRIGGLVCAGYPFHPPRKPGALRVAHLAALACPTLIVQGERDPLGNLSETGDYILSPAICFAWIPDGDHDFAPRRASGHTLHGNIAQAAAAIARFALPP